MGAIRAVFCVVLAVERQGQRSFVVSVLVCSMRAPCECYNKVQVEVALWQKVPLFSLA